MIRVIFRYHKTQYAHMVKTTKLIKQKNGEYKISISEEDILELGWSNGHVLKIEVDDNRIVIEKLSGFMGK